MFLLLFTQIFALFCRNFSGTNVLACDCNVYNSLVSVINALSSSSAAVCASPPRVASVQFYPGGSYENHPVQDFTCCMYLYCHVYAVKPPLLDTLLRTHSLLQILFITVASLIRAPLHYRQSITDISPFWTPLYYGHLSTANTLYYRHPSSMVFITDIFNYGHLSCVKTSLLKTLLWKPLYYGHLSTASTHQLQTSLIWTCLYYGHLSVSTANIH